MDNEFNLFKSTTSKHMNFLTQYIKIGENINKTIFKLENKTLEIVILNGLTDLVKKKFGNKAQIMENQHHKIAVLEFENPDNLTTFLKEINQSKEIKEELEMKGKIIISEKRIENLPLLKINNSTLKNNLKDLMMIDDNTIETIFSMFNKTTLYLATVKNYLNQKLTQTNYKNYLIDYQEDLCYNIVVNNEILQAIKKKKLPLNFIIK